MKIKRDKRDAIFSHCIRERSNWTCEKCGRYFPEGSRQGLHASHLWGRRHRAVRWDPYNVFAHCFSCHQLLGESPVEFAKWAKDKLGEGMMHILRDKARGVAKFTKTDLEECYQHYQQEFARMRKLRGDGKTGWIEIIPWI